MRTLKSVFIFKVQPWSSSASCDEISQTSANLLKLFVGPLLSSLIAMPAKEGPLLIGPARTCQPKVRGSSFQGKTGQTEIAPSPSKQRRIAPSNTRRRISIAISRELLNRTPSSLKPFLPLQKTPIVKMSTESSASPIGTHD